MAEEIVFDHHQRNAKQELYHQLHSAPEEHVEALLDVYALVQLLHDKGIFELMKDSLGAGEQVLGVLTETLEREEVVRTIRNLTIFIKMIGAMEPDTLEKIMKSLSNQFEGAKAQKKPPGLLRLLGQLADADSRRAMAPVAAALQTAGRSIPKPPTKERTKTMRHKA